MVESGHTAEVRKISRIATSARGGKRSAGDGKYLLDRIADADRHVLTGQKAGIVLIDVPEA